MPCTISIPEQGFEGSTVMILTHENGDKEVAFMNGACKATIEFIKAEELKSVQPEPNFYEDMTIQEQFTKDAEFYHNGERVEIITLDAHLLQCWVKNVRTGQVYLTDLSNLRRWR